MSIMPLLFRSSLLRTTETMTSIIIGLFMLPFMISSLGEELYGVWILIGGFTASLHLMDLGFASAVTRFMARNLARKEYDGANEIVSSAFVIYLVLGMMVGCLTLIIAVVSDIWVTDPGNVDMVFTLILITGLALAIEFPFKSFAGVSVAYMRYDLVALSRIFVKVISTIMIIWALTSGYELIAIAIISFGSTILSNIISFAIAKYLFKEMSISFSGVRLYRIKELSGFSFWAFLTDASNILRKKLDVFMIGYFIGVSTLTVYYVSLRLVEYSLALLSRATGITMPIFTENASNDKIDDLQSNIIIFLRVNLILGCFAIFISVLFGYPLIELWMGSKFDVELAYYSLCILMSGKMVLFIFGPLASALMAIYRHQWLSYIGIGELGLSVVLIYLAIGVYDFGILGAAVGLVAPLVFTRFIFLPIIIQKEVGLSFYRTYANLFRPFVSFLLAFFVCYQLKNYFFDVSKIYDNILFLFISSIIYGVLTMSSLRRKEWEHLFNIFPGKISNSFIAKKLSGK